MAQINAELIDILLADKIRLLEFYKTEVTKIEDSINDLHNLQSNLSNQPSVVQPSVPNEIEVPKEVLDQAKPETKEPPETKKVSLLDALSLNELGSFYLAYLRNTKQIGEGKAHPDEANVIEFINEVKEDGVKGVLNSLLADKLQDVNYMNPIINWVKQNPLDLSIHNIPKPKDINPQQSNTHKVKDLKDYKIEELKELGYNELVEIANANNLDISNYNSAADRDGILTVILIAFLQVASSQG